MVRFGRNVEWIVEVPVPARVTSRNVSTKDASMDASVQMVGFGFAISILANHKFFGNLPIIFNKAKRQVFFLLLSFGQISLN